MAEKNTEAAPDPLPDPVPDLRKRINAFERMGFDLLTATELAWHRDVSISAVRELLRKGCPLAAAARIVL